MKKSRLKEAEIKDGKIWLEGKVLENPELLELRIIENLTFGDLTGGKLSREILERKIREEGPEKANVYVLGQEVCKVFGGEESGGLEYHNCVLYLNSGLRE